MTIRLRLTLWYTALLGATLILFSVAVYSALAANLWAQVEQDASRQASEVATALQQQLQLDILVIRNSPGRVEFPELDFFSSASGVQVVGLDGMISKRSSNLDGAVVPGYRNALDTVGQGENHRYYVTNDDGVFMLVHSTPLMVDNQIVGAVQVVKSVNAVSVALNQVIRYLILGTALSLVLAAIVGAFLARRTLTPIDAITQTASSITQSKDLSKRLDIVEDQSEVGRLAATFNAMLNQIEQLFAMQQQLIADVSHDLRTPLTTVQGNVELLQRMSASVQAGRALPQETLATIPEILDEVEGETTRMSAMISDLLLLAQADSGALEMQTELVEMDTLLLDVYRQAVRMAERERGPNGLDVRLGGEDQVLVRGDRERLRQLLLNLVDNAIKYTPGQGVITLGLERRAQWVRVYVEDTGIGISAQNQQRIFDRFFRADKARNREIGGSGLGLSIVAWIAEAHNGQITVESAPGKGSTFALCLPLAPEEQS